MGPAGEADTNADMMQAVPAGRVVTAAAEAPPRAGEAGALPLLKILAPHHPLEEEAVTKVWERCAAAATSRF